MNPIKALGWELACVSLMAASCNSTRITAQHGSSTLAFAQDTPENYTVRALSIAQQEAEQPHGFTVFSKDFAETKNSFAEQDFKTLTTVGLNFPDSTIYLKAFNKTQNSNDKCNCNCNRSSTVYMGKYGEQSPEIQELFRKGKKTAEGKSSRASVTYAHPMIGATDSNTIIIKTDLGLGFTDKIAVDFKDGTISREKCNGIKTEASKEEFYKNRRMVDMADRYKHSTQFRIGKSYRTYEL